MFVGGEETRVGPKEPSVTKEVGSHGPVAEAGTSPDIPVLVPCEALRARG